MLVRRRVCFVLSVFSVVAYPVIPPTVVRIQVHFGVRILPPLGRCESLARSVPSSYHLYLLAP